MKDTHKRSILKTITWRICATLATIALVWFFVRDMAVAFSVGAVEIIAKTTVYYFHERSWNKIKWGKSNYDKQSTERRKS